MTEKIWIAGVGYYLPEDRVTNEEIIDRHGLRIKASWIEKNIGIRERRWAKPGLAASDLGTRAAESTKGLHLDKFNGSLFVSTLSPDFLSPSTASILKRKLGIKTRGPAVDMQAACVGQLFALDAAYCKLLSSPDEKESLVVGTELRSRYLNKQDRRTVFLFGDGASAIYLRKDQDAPGHIEWTLTCTVASEDYEILIPGGGSLKPLSQEVLDASEHLIQMVDGEKIFKSTTETLTQEIREQLAKKGMSLRDFDFFLFHQANGAIIKKICTELEVSPDRTWINFDRYGNTSSASLGIALAEAYEAGKIKKGQRVLLISMGAGYHFGMVSVLWGI